MGNSLVDKMADDEETFEQADAGASLVYPMEAGQVRKGGYMVIKGFPCKVVEISVSKTGKHGHAKCNIVGMDVFTGNKHQALSPSTHNIEVPVVKREQYTCIDITDEFFASLMDDDGNTREDLKVPDDLVKQVKDLLDEDGDCQADVMSAMGTEKIIAVKKSAA